MPVWFTFIGAIFGTAAMMGGLYFVVIAFIEVKRAKASPRMGLVSGGKPGTLGFWVSWDPAAFTVQVYRIRFNLYHPHGYPQESMFSVSYDPVQKTPFLQTIELPTEWLALLEGKNEGHDAIITCDFRTIEELTLSADYKVGTVKRIYHGKSQKVPSNVTKLTDARPDVATVMTLDFSEWTARKKRLRDLEAAAKAKAAQKAATAAAAPAPKPVAATATAAPAAGSAIPSVKDIIAQENAKNKEAVKP